MLQQNEISEQESNCNELLKRRIMLEKLVDRLQEKLREEKSRRRQLEQEVNLIPEESFNDNDEDSTI